MLHNVIIQAAHYYSEKEKQVAAHIRVKYGNAMVFAHPTQRRRQPCLIVMLLLTLISKVYVDAVQLMNRFLTPVFYFL